METSKRHNSFIARSAMSAVVYGDMFMRAIRQQPKFEYYSIDSVSVHINDSAFRVVLFFLAGIMQATKFETNYIGTAGLLMWFVGQSTILSVWEVPIKLNTLMSVQHYYLNLAYVDSFMVAFGGGLFFWSVCSEQSYLNMESGSQKILKLFYVLAPSIYILAETPLTAYSPIDNAKLNFVVVNWFLVISSMITIFLCLESPTANTDQPQEPPKSLWALPHHTFRGLFLVALGYTFYAPFVCTGTHFQQRGYSQVDRLLASMILATGCVAGSLFAAMALKYTIRTLCFMGLAQAIALGVWAAVENTASTEAMCALLFFVSFASSGIFSLVLQMQPLPPIGPFGIACLMIGSALSVYSYQSFTNLGQLDLYLMLSVSAGVSAAGTVCCVLSEALRV